MADGSHTPRIRLGLPLVSDYLYLAQRMRPDEIAQWLTISQLPEYSADACARAYLAIPGPAHAMIDANGYPVLIGGHEPIRPGVWQGWLIGSMEGWGEYGREITRHCRRLQDNLLATDHAHRVQIIAAVNRPQAHDWYVRGLGMTFEGVRRGYFPDGSDAVEFSRIKGDCRVQPVR